MNAIINTLLLLAIICGLFYIWRGVSGRGWYVPTLSESLPSFSVPDTRGMGQGLACKWSGTC